MGTTMADADRRLLALCTDNSSQLERIADLLDELSTTEYTQTQAAADPIGKHVRHVLEHYEGLLNGYPGGAIDYEVRAREPELEKSPAAAEQRLRSLQQRLRELPNNGGPGTLLTHYTPQCDESAAWIASTLERELHFLLSHTIHHMALIGLLAQGCGQAVDPGFGVAGSTLRHQRASSSETIDPEYSAQA